MKLDPVHNKRPDDPKFVDSLKTPLTEAEATYYLKTAWKQIYGSEPSIKSLALLWAQSCGETWRWKLLRNNNWGNIKRRVYDTELKWTSYEAGENLTINGVFKHYMFYPYHNQTHFAAWDDPLDGAKYYIKFLSQKTRYKKAWAALMIGDPIAYCRELKAGGYFTAPLDHYTKGVVSLTNEFKRKAALLMAWEPPKPELPSEPEIIEPIPEEPELKPEPEEPEEPEEPVTTIPETKKEAPKNFLLMIIEFIKNLFS